MQTMCHKNIISGNGLLDKSIDMFGLEELNFDVWIEMSDLILEGVIFLFSL